MAAPRDHSAASLASYASPPPPLDARGGATLDGIGGGRGGGGDTLRPPLPCTHLTVAGRETRPCEEGEVRIFDDSLVRATTAMRSASVSPHPDAYAGKRAWAGGM